MKLGRITVNSVKGKCLEDVCEEVIWKGVRDREGRDIEGEPETCCTKSRNL